MSCSLQSKVQTDWSLLGCWFFCCRSRPGRGQRPMPQFWPRGHFGLEDLTSLPKCHVLKCKKYSRIINPDALPSIWRQTIINQFNQPGLKWRPNVRPTHLLTLFSTTVKCNSEHNEVVLISWHQSFRTYCAVKVGTYTRVAYLNFLGMVGSDEEHR